MEGGQWGIGRKRNNSSTVTVEKVEFKGIGAGRDQFDIDNKRPLSSDCKKRKRTTIVHFSESPYTVFAA